MEQCRVIAVGLEEAVQLPEKVRAMLAGMVRGSLLSYKDHRRACQDEVVEMISSALVGVEERLLREADEAQAKVQSSDTDQARRSEARQEAESRLSELKETAQQTAAAREQGAAALERARLELGRAVAAQEDGNSELAALVLRRERVEEAERDACAPLKERAAGAGEERKLPAALRILGKWFKIDESLVVALPGALRMEPHERTPADVAVVDQVHEHLLAMMTDLSARIADAEPVRAKQAADVEAARVVFDRAKEAWQRSGTDCDEAQARADEASVQVRAAKEATDGFCAEVKDLVESRNASKARLDAFRNGPLAAFRALRERRLPDAAAAEEEEEAARPAGEAGAYQHASPGG